LETFYSLDTEPEPEQIVTVLKHCLSKLCVLIFFHMY